MSVFGVRAMWCHLSLVFKPAWSLGPGKGENMFTCDIPESAFKSVLNLISVPGDVEVSSVPNMAEVKFGNHQAVAGSPFFL